MQIRRMFATLGHQVVALHRHTIGALTLEGLPEGEWRYLQPEDLEAVFGGPEVDVGSGEGAAAGPGSRAAAAAAPKGGRETKGAAGGARVTEGGGSSWFESKEGASGAAGVQEAWQQGEEGLAVEGEAGEEAEDTELVWEQAALSKRYRNSVRHKQRRAALQDSMARMGAAQQPQAQQGAPST